MGIKLRRVFAFGIDMIIVGFLASWLSYLFSLGPFLTMIFLLVLFCSKDICFKNASIGKCIMGIRIVDYVGSKPLIKRIIMRNIPSVLLSSYDFICIVGREDKVGDRWAETTVILEPIKNSVTKGFENKTPPTTFTPRLILKRGFAFLIDWLLVAAFMAFYMSTIAEKGSTESTRLLLTMVGFIIWGCCLCIRDIIFRNASLGKIIMGLRVVDVDDKKPAITKILLRNITMLIVPFIGVEVLALLLSREHFRIGESLSKTKVMEKALLNSSL